MSRNARGGEALAPGGDQGERGALENEGGLVLRYCGAKASKFSHVTLLFSGIAKVAGAASWNKSPRPVCLDRRVGQTRKRKRPHEEGDAAAGLVASEGHIALGRPPCPGEAGWRGRQARLGM